MEATEVTENTTQPSSGRSPLRSPLKSRSSRSSRTIQAGSGGHHGDHWKLGEGQHGGYCTKEATKSWGMMRNRVGSHTEAKMEVNQVSEDLQLVSSGSSRLAIWACNMKPLPPQKQQWHRLAKLVENGPARLRPRDVQLKIARWQDQSLAFGGFCRWGLHKCSGDGRQELGRWTCSCVAELTRPLVAPICWRKFLHHNRLKTFAAHDQILSPSGRSDVEVREEATHGCVTETISQNNTQEKVANEFRLNLRTEIQAITSITDDATLTNNVVVEKAITPKWPSLARATSLYKCR